VHQDQATEHRPEQPSNPSGEKAKTDASHQSTVINDSHKVLITLRGKRMETDTLRQAIEEDGRMRRLPWNLSSGREGIFPTNAKPALRDRQEQGSQAQKQETQEAQNSHDPVEGYSSDLEVLHNRFIICFPESAEARRFVRTWHKRSIFLRNKKDDDLEVDASLIW
jgi:hypothetical protein